MSTSETNSARNVIEPDAPGHSGTRSGAEDAIASGSLMQRFAGRLSGWTERWFPDAYVIALLALLIVCAAALSIGAAPTAVVASVGDGYWNLVPFAYQMAMVIITGFALATCRPVRRLILRLAAVPRTGPGAVAFTVFVSIVAGLLNWGFGMMLSAFLVMALVRRDDLHVDIRAAAAAGLIGTSSTAMLGLSSSAALLHATPSSVPPALLEISGEIPFSDSIFLWQNGVVIVVMAAVAVAVAYATAPRGPAVCRPEDLGIDRAKLLPSDDEPVAAERRPGDWLSESPLLVILVGGLWLWWIVMKFADIGVMATVSNLNNYLFICLTLALLLHWRIRRFLNAVREAVPAVGGVLIQFPIYAAVASVLVLAKNDQGASVATYLGDFFVSVGDGNTLAPVVAVYSIVVGVFIPSAGAKWVLEAPYVLEAGNTLNIHLGWLIQVYGGAEATANLLNPFWMLPLLGLLGLRARNVVGFTFVYFIFLAPTMIFLSWALAYTLNYHPPMMP